MLAPMAKKIRFLFKAIFILVLCQLFPACYNQSDTTMRLGTNLWPGYEPLYLARHLNLLQKNKIRLIEYPSASEIIRAFRNNSLEAAALTLDEVLTMRHDNIKAVVVMVLDVSQGADVIIGNLETQTFSQLTNKTVAVESSALGAYVISRALEINQMSFDDIQIKPLDISEHLDAFRTGQVDAVVTFEPVRTQLLNFGGNELFNSRQIPGEIVDVLVIRQDYLKQNPQQAQALATSWFKAIEYFERFPQKTAQIMAQRLKITPKEVIDSYQGLQLCNKQCNQSMLNSTNGSLKSTLEQLAQTMVKIDLLNHQPSIVDVLDDQLVRQ